MCAHWINKCYEGLIFLGALYFTTLVPSLVATLWVCFSPIAFTMFIIEVVIRLIIGKWQCPRFQQKCRQFQYGLYKYSSIIAKETQSCAICLEEYTISDVNLCILQCKTNHIFHEECIFQWMAKQIECPICRGEVNFKLS